MKKTRAEMPVIASGDNYKVMRWKTEPSMDTLIVFAESDKKALEVTECNVKNKYICVIDGVTRVWIVERHRK